MFEIKSQRRKVTKSREDELRKQLLQGDTRTSVEAKKAITYCEFCIADYEEWFDHNEARWLRLQRVVIIGSVVATLAGAITLPDEWLNAANPANAAKWTSSFGWLRGVPAGVVTIAAGYLSSFTYKEDAVRHEVTAMALWNELAKFMSHAEPYNKSESKDTSAFLNAICRLVDNELKTWSALATSGSPTKE
jgi:hypothetical protein